MPVCRLTIQQGYPIVLPLLILLLLLGSCSNADDRNRRDQRLHQALNYYRNQKFTEAGQLTQNLIRKHPDWPAPQILNAKILFITRKFREAENQLRETLDKNPNHPYARQWLARAIATQPERLTEAVAVLAQMLQRNPDDSVAHYLLARCAERLGQREKAIRHYQEAISVSATVSRAHLRLADLLNRNNLPERARRHLEQVRALNLKSHAKEAKQLLKHMDRQSEAGDDAG